MEPRHLIAGAAVVGGAVGAYLIYRHVSGTSTSPLAKGRSLPNLNAQEPKLTSIPSTEPLSRADTDKVLDAILDEAQNTDTSAVGDPDFDFDVDDNGNIIFFVPVEPEEKPNALQACTWDDKEIQIPGHGNVLYPVGSGSKEGGAKEGWLGLLPSDKNAAAVINVQFGFPSVGWQRMYFTLTSEGIEYAEAPEMPSGAGKRKTSTYGAGAAADRRRSSVFGGGDKTPKTPPRKVGFADNKIVILASPGNLCQFGIHISDHNEIIPIQANSPEEAKDWLYAISAAVRAIGVKWQRRAANRQRASVRPAVSEPPSEQVHI